MLTIALITALLHVGLPAAGKEASPLQKEEDWPVGSAMQVGLAHNKRAEELDKAILSRGDELLKVIAEGVESPDSRIREALVAERVEWSRYRDASCELVGAATGAGGVWPSTYGAECRVVMSEKRLAGLEACLEELRKLSPQTRQWEVSKCVQMQGIISTE